VKGEPVSLLFVEQLECLCPPELAAADTATLTRGTGAAGVTAGSARWYGNRTPQCPGSFSNLLGPAGPSGSLAVSDKVARKQRIMGESLRVMEPKHLAVPHCIYPS
jgi:hypothetical protein